MVFLCLAAAAFASGCAGMATQGGGAPAGGDLRALVMQTRREVDELRRDQELLRSQVEYLQHAESRREEMASTAIPAIPPVDVPPTISSELGSAAAPTGVGGGFDATTPSPPAIAAAPPTYPAAPPTYPAAPPVPGAPTTADPLIAAVRGTGQGTVPGGGTAAADGAIPGDATASEVPAVPTELRGSGYDDAARSFVQEQYDDAIQYFRDFVHTNSTSQYADDAQYWIGESYLRKGVYQNAIKEFNQVVLRYGAGDRSAPALLKLAQVFSKIGDQVDARLSLQKLANRYPGTPEASEAYRLLQQMGG